ncbi:MAG: rhomboid family intramembrane serine protease [Thermodesulfobacteriota bacterium]
MIPLKDNIPRIRQPVVVVSIFVLNLIVFLWEMMLPERALVRLVHLHGAVPLRLLDPAWASWAGYPDGAWLTPLTYMFLHGGWLHFLLNMWVLWVFADNVEDAMGHARFTLFYVLSGLAALALHVMFNSSSAMPVVGASGAIAGVMGAYFRLFPQARVIVLIPLLFIPWIVEVPAMVFLGLWFLIQVSSGLMAGSPLDGGQSVAWWAHAGGFAFGMLLVRHFGRLDCRYCYLPESRSYERQDPQDS